MVVVVEFDSTLVLPDAKPKFPVARILPCDHCAFAWNPKRIKEIERSTLLIKGIIGYSMISDFRGRTPLRTPFSKHEKTAVNTAVCLIGALMFLENPGQPNIGSGE